MLIAIMPYGSTDMAIWLQSQMPAFLANLLILELEEPIWVSTEKAIQFEHPDQEIKLHRPSMKNNS